MLELYLNQFPETPFEILLQTAKQGFQYFRMADSVDKGVLMLIKVSTYQASYLSILIKKGDVKGGVEILK
jgi:hypothetical protein